MAQLALWNTFGRSSCSSLGRKGIPETSAGLFKKRKRVNLAADNARDADLINSKNFHKYSNPTNAPIDRRIWDLF